MPPLALRRLSALLSVVSSMERIALHCAAIADLVPDLAPAVRGDPATRRAVELAGVQTRARLVHARDLLQAWSSSWGPTVSCGHTDDADADGGLLGLAAITARLPHGSSMAAALPLLVEDLGHVDDEAQEIAELASRGRSRWGGPSGSAELDSPLGLSSGVLTVSVGAP
jgi:hypothetical protein